MAGVKCSPAVGAAPSPAPSRTRSGSAASLRRRLGVARDVRGSGGRPCDSSSAAIVPCSRAITRAPSGSASITRSRTRPAWRCTPGLQRRPGRTSARQAPSFSGSMNSSSTGRPASSSASTRVGKSPVSRSPRDSHRPQQARQVAERAVLHDAGSATHSTQETRGIRASRRAPGRSAPSAGRNRTRQRSHAVSVHVERGGPRNGPPHPHARSAPGNPWRSSLPGPRRSCCRGRRAGRR